MVTDIRIYVAIGLFIIACVSLMIFNLLIIRYSRARHTPSPRRVDRWMTILYTQTIITGITKPGSDKHDKVLLRKLQKARHLITYSQALQILKSRFPKAYHEYVQDRHTTFRKLAITYQRKSCVEKTCYADFISKFPELAGDSYGRLAEVLISYIDDSSIHCRTKVLSALCSLGTAQGVVNALHVMNDRSLFMHNQLLTNELSRFVGEKEVLGWRLWSEGRHWNDNLLVSTVQFITKFSDRYVEIFFPVLQNASTGKDVRAAIIHYYEKHIYEPVRPVLINFIYDHKNNVELSIEAASALGKYPAPETVATLKNALSSPNWHVRYNASDSLLRTGRKDDLLHVLQYGNPHEKEIITYIVEFEDAMQNSGTQLNMFDEEIYQ